MYIPSSLSHTGPCPPSACTKGQDLPLCCHEELQKKGNFQQAHASRCNASDSSPAVKSELDWVWIEVEICSGNFQLATDPEITLFSVWDNAECTGS